MINRLNRSHFAIIPPEVYQAIETRQIYSKGERGTASGVERRREG
jgi:hypothetical protein